MARKSNYAMAYPNKRVYYPFTHYGGLKILRRQVADTTLPHTPLLLRHGNYLPNYWKLHTGAEKRRKKHWPFWALISPKQPVISVESPCFASRARTRRHRLRILRVRARAINIPRRHIRVSLVPRPLSRFYVGSGYRD